MILDQIAVVTVLFCFFLEITIKHFAGHLEIFQGRLSGDAVSQMKAIKNRKITLVAIIVIFLAQQEQILLQMFRWLHDHIEKNICITGILLKKFLSSQ